MGANSKLVRGVQRRAHPQSSMSIVVVKGILFRLEDGCFRCQQRPKSLYAGPAQLAAEVFAHIDLEDFMSVITNRREDAYLAVSRQSDI